MGTKFLAIVLVCLFQYKQINAQECHCQSIGDGHYKQFDGNVVNYQGDSEYYLAKTCDGAGGVEPFAISAKRGAFVELQVYGHVVRLLRDVDTGSDYCLVDNIAYKGWPVVLNAGIGKTIKVELQPNLRLRVSTDSGISVSFDPELTSIDIPAASYSGSGILCGVCGNCNGVADDYVLPDSTDISGIVDEALRDATLCDGWSVSDPSGQPVPDPPGVYSDAEKTAAAQDSYCGLINKPGSFFDSCRQNSGIAFAEYYQSCEADVLRRLAQDPNGAQHAACIVLEALVEGCKYAGEPVDIEWRSSALCPLDCRGMTYSSSLPGCPETCASQLSGEVCTKPPTEGCTCGVGLLIEVDINHQLTCDHGSMCDFNCVENRGGPYDGTYRKFLQQWTVDCATMESYTCYQNNIYPMTVVCPEHSTCQVNFGIRKCYCDIDYVMTTDNTCTYLGPDLCQDVVCQNNGVCLKETGTCSCHLGFTGGVCETNIDDCENEPCLNDGKCIDEVNDFTCLCANGFTGEICETNIDDCVNSPCLNGGSCIDMVADYQCDCLHGFSGRNCEIHETPCTCFVAGDPHFYSYDGSWIHFQGTCKYRLTKNTNAGLKDFDIFVQNEHRHNITGVSWVHSVEIHVYGHVIIIGDKVQVDGVIINSLPYLLNGSPGYIDITPGKTIQLKTEMFMVAVSGGDAVRVEVSRDYSGHLKGICGDCNADPSNDYVTSNGFDVSGYPPNVRDVIVGNSFKVQDIPGCVDGDVNDGAICTSEEMALVESLDYCGAINDVNGVFGDCISTGRLNNFFEPCRMDVCAVLNLSPDLAKTTACVILSTVADMCSQILPYQSPEWRTVLNCELPCGENEHYEAVGPGCPATCVNRNPPSNCNPNTTEGCFCNDGYLWSSNKCVLVKDCGCLDDMGNYRQAGESWINDDCSIKYECQGDENIVSTPVACDKNADCGLFNGKQGCQCREGYKGDGFNCTDIDECGGPSDDCAQICINVPGTFNCACNNGFTLNTNLKDCDDINECLQPDNGGCNQHCTNTIGSRTCSCDDGYFLDMADHATCKDIDECKDNNGGCEQVCTNKVGTFECSCNTGYVLRSDGANCDDINECATLNGGCDHTCENSVGSYQCKCHKGYMLLEDEHMCKDIDECATDNGGCNQTCKNTEGAYYCSCHDGFTMDADGKNCNNNDECLIDNGGCAHTCQDTYGGYVCSCDDGYSLGHDSHGCEDVDECTWEPAVCEQICNNTEGFYKCDCFDGYRLNADGEHCDEINECEEEPLPKCENGGTCVNKINDYDCNCTTAPGFTGEHCEININDCLGVICLNSGTCVDKIQDYTCECIHGFTGKHCETKYKYNTMMSASLIMEAVHTPVRIHMEDMCVAVTMAIHLDMTVMAVKTWMSAHGNLLYVNKSVTILKDTINVTVSMATDSMLMENTVMKSMNVKRNHCQSVRMVAHV
ncbi:fibropellin-1 [Lingula anatina]|uniref:Fibropellin-1 n=1 Tax=Lingula anatina TaxID=7574 RepID=A0A2R2MMN7_LINAN|nr:fibropellin-1 [Lingula anatina]|eukprot:XP_023931493.1 fibropellin-1 [Lingula anatina]